MNDTNVLPDLQKEHHPLPIVALRDSTRELLANDLDKNGSLVKTSDGRHYFNNYIGLAELDNFSQKEIEDIKVCNVYLLLKTR